MAGEEAPEQVADTDGGWGRDPARGRHEPEGDLHAFARTEARRGDAATALAGMKLRLSQYLGYVGGEVANLASAMVSSFLLFYPHRRGRIAGRATGTMFLVARWGGVTDLIASGVRRRALLLVACSR